MNWKLGNVAGIPINIHWSFWLLPLVVLFSSTPGGGDLAFRLLILFLIFGCVVLHELGHALMARLFHVRTRDITLYPIGGVASLERMPRNSFAELAIAVAGPAVNVAIAAALVVVMLPLSGVLGGFTAAVLQTLLYANVVLVLFNMLPVFPMDGGRVLRAVMGWFVPYAQATKVAARIGQAFALVLGVIGLFSGGTLILVAVFVFFAAQAELMMVRQQERFGEYSAYAAHPLDPAVGQVDAAEPGPAPTANPRADASQTPGASAERYVLLDKRGRVISTYN